MKWVVSIYNAMCWFIRMVSTRGSSNDTSFLGRMKLKVPAVSKMSSFPDPTHIYKGNNQHCEHLMEHNCRMGWFVGIIYWCLGWNTKASLVYVPDADHGEASLLHMLFLTEERAW